MQVIVFSGTQAQAMRSKCHRTGEILVGPMKNFIALHPASYSGIVINGPKFLSFLGRYENDLAAHVFVIDDHKLSFKGAQINLRNRCIRNHIAD